MPVVASWLNQVELWFAKIERTYCRAAFHVDSPQDSSVNQQVHRRPETHLLDLQHTGASHRY